MRTLVLAKWGNSQGVRIPREICDELGVDIGSKAHVTVDVEAGTITMGFERSQQRYRRTRKLTIDELVASWPGGRVGDEWSGPDVGAEVVE